MSRRRVSAAQLEREKAETSRLLPWRKAELPEPAPTCRDCGATFIRASLLPVLGGESFWARPCACGCGVVPDEVAA